jgi:two-component system, NarL family, response regulator NreC
MITILLADDHQLVRQGLRALLQGEKDFQVVGEAGDGIEALALVERAKPDILLLDMMMPGMNGLEVARQAKELVPRTRVLILSMQMDEAYVLNALRVGAIAYVLKQSTASDLVKAIREAMQDRRFLSPPLSDRLIDRYVQKPGTGPLDPFNTLTERERVVLQLVAEGHAGPEIATRLCISPRTVEMHRASLMRKLGLRSLADLIRYAIQKGIVAME